MGTYFCPAKCASFCAAPPPQNGNKAKALGSCQSGSAFAGDPINIATGNTFERVTDYTPGDKQDPAFQRFYNSDAADQKAHMGAHWRNTFSASIIRDGDQATVYRPDGQVLIFTQSGDQWAADEDITATLDSIGDIDASEGWRYHTPHNTVETYDAQGHLTQIVSPGRYRWSLAYNSNGWLTSVTSASGRVLQFQHDAQGRIISVTLPGGQAIQYSYGDADNLIRVAYPAGSGQTSIAYRYDNSEYPHALTGLVDANGATYASWQYDDEGRAIASMHSDGADKTQLAYSDDTTTVTNALGRQTVYFFDVVQGVPRVTDIKGLPTATCAGANQAYSYTGEGWIASATDWDGHQTNYAYNARGLQIRRTEAAGTPEERTVTTRWSPDFRRPTDIDAPGRTIHLAYDSDQRLIRQTLTDTTTGATRVWSYTYMPDSDGQPGRLHTVDGPRTDVSDITMFAYDARGSLASITDAMGHTTRITDHDASGRPLALVDANGVTTTLAYDARGRLISRNRAGNTLQLSYDAAGNLVRIDRADGSYLRFAYDDAHRLIRITNGRGDHVDYTLDAAGNRIKTAVHDADGTLAYQHRRTFDALSRLLQSLGAANQIVSYGYDANGNRVSVTDPRGHQTTYAYDALDRLVQTTDPLGGITRRHYNAQDRVTRITDARGNATQYTYNGLGDLTGIASPDRGEIAYVYDRAGNPIQRTDANGSVTEYRYDALNRLTNVSYKGYRGPDRSYSYDDPEVPNGIGRLTGMTDSAGHTTLGYDRQGHITTLTRVIHDIAPSTIYLYGAPEPKTVYHVHAAYDSAGHLTQHTYPSGRQVRYRYNANGRLSAVVLENHGHIKTLASDITHAPFGGLTGLVYGNGLQLTRRYDNDGQLTKWQVHGIIDDRYAYDPAGNRKSRTEASGAEIDYSYDALNRLTGATGAGFALHYAYDALGNRVQSSRGDEHRSYTIAPESNRLQSIQGADTTQLRYNSAGLLTDYGPFLLEYDATHRLVFAFTPIYGQVWTYGASEDAESAAPATEADSGTMATYAYGAMGHRVAKLVNGVTQHFIHGPRGHLLGVYRADGTPERELVWLQDTLLAVIHNGQAYYVHTNPVGAPVAVTDAAQKIVWRWRPTPFGRGAVDNDPDGDGRTFTLRQRLPGQYADSGTGFYSNGFRNYDPETGRYLEPDPMGLVGGINPYRYVGDNPLQYIDPLGLWQLTIAGGIGYGGLVTIGNNGGQWSVGGYIGVGEGFSVSLDPQDSGVHASGFEPGNRGEGVIGLGPNVHAFTNVGPSHSFAGISGSVPGTPLELGASVKNGHAVPPDYSFGFGESGFIGTGGNFYFNPPSPEVNPSLPGSLCK
ncbi:RHS repeat-associated core domain-containing protein [Salinisphaera sp.]|uniref:RHS repeat-associated core domain-containing protein n=1 Tax=Salinisphaera sp. TaxID=1914330 RepID=UPI002D790CC2|nr:RHS repeat-associated core domain-containing protein [Salinisphaera sp.]HET7313097.1 RHS repeat-associated core domain-containing protein [Salinisphaera sp.]